MKDTRRTLLQVDGVLNTLFGIALLAHPAGVIGWLGLPPAHSAFYPSLLGAVLLGIGFALFIEARRGGDGLGVRGAIVINLAGGGLLLVWLLSGRLETPVHGTVLLWLVAVSVLGLCMVEALGLRKTTDADE